MSARHDLGDLIAGRMPATVVYAYPVDPDQVEAGGAVVIAPTTVTLASIDGTRTERTFDIFLLVTGDDPAPAEDDLDDLVTRFITATRPGLGGAGLTLATLTRGTYQDTFPAYSGTITIHHEE